uniref:Mediator of RNA polymerase II transcription subunit 26 n=1 Tax=Phallusia mammillata TaxID=59560 RepID=A0A6F9DJV9_9ASCI|nr:mediator of RNA polymerase II transcription subunit 26-like [Phallusia mammillata]
MQDMSLTPRQIKDRLLRVMKDDGSVRDSRAALEIITLLENTTITKTELEDTRLGKYINNVRKAAKDPVLQKRAKKLIKTWQRMIDKALQPHMTPNEKPPNATQNTPVQAHKGPQQKRHVSNIATKGTNSPSTVNGDGRDRKHRVNPVVPSSAVKLKTDATFYKSALHKTSKRSRSSTPRQSPENRRLTSSPRNTHLPKRETLSPPTPPPNLTCKPNGLKLKKSPHPPPSPPKEYQPLWSEAPHSKSRHKRKREDDVSPPDSLDSTRTNEEVASSSMTSSSNLSPLSQGITAYTIDVETAPQSVEIARKHSPLNVAKASTFTDSVSLPVTQQYVPKPRDHNEPDEWPGVDGCLGGNGAWYTWSDSIFVQRPSVVSSEDSTELDALSILPYVELD